MLLNETIFNVCSYLNNYFVQGMPQEEGVFALKDRQIALEGDYPRGRWLLLTSGIGIFRISEKTEMDDGFVYTLDYADGIDHEWQGIVYMMNLPLSFIGMCTRINAWTNSQHGQPTTLQREHVVGLYSWEAAVGADGLPIGWQEIFRNELRLHPKQMATGVRA